MAEDLGKLSPEQVKKLAGVISEAKSLTSQQAEIIEKVLAGETDIGKLRISYLKEYFDIYSRNLDMLARKHSALNDAYLVLDKKVSEGFKKANDLAATIRYTSSIDDDSEQPEPKKNIKKSPNKSKKSKEQPESSDEGDNTPPASNKKPTKVSTKVSEEQRAKMSEETDSGFSDSDGKRRADQLARFFRQNEEERRNTIISEAAYLDAIESRRQEKKIKQLKEHSAKIEKIDKSIMDLEILRHQTEEDRQNHITEIRLKRVQDSLDAEIGAQTLINSIAAELAYANGDNYVPEMSNDPNVGVAETANNKSELPINDTSTPATPQEQNIVVVTEQPETKAKQAVEPAASDPFLTTDIRDYGQSQPSSVGANEAQVRELGANAAPNIAVIDTDNPNIGNNGQEVTETGEIRAREASAKDKLKAAQDFENSIVAFRARKELESRRRNGGILTKEESSRIEKEIAKRFTLEKLNDKKRLEARFKLEEAETRKAERDNIRKVLSAKPGSSFAENKKAWDELTKDESGERDPSKAISAAIIAVSDLATQLEKKIDEIASFKGAIDTRLQGSSNQQYAGSYWDQLVRDMTSVGAINPYFKQETFANNMKSLVEKGIAFDLKQRAFLMTIQEKIANTFDVADGTLLRLIRIQQEDSTAGRLGMESALNTFLNNMYETSEYLNQVADSVRGSLEEMQALMTGAEAAEVEYQVQKWLGSLYSVGMSQNAVQGISDALGKIAAGQIEGLTGGGASNLLVMAANDAGLSIADILANGINSSDTNKLLQAAVNYLAELSKSAEDNKVVQQQLADVFGVKASDLRAATNLVLPGSTSAISSSNLSYNNMIAQLSSMAGSMGKRTSIAEMMTNFWENGQYTLAGSMASNPVSYFIYKMAKVVDDAAGGIDLPFINVMGFGVDLNTTVSDLMRVAAVGAGILGSIGPLVSGLGSSFSGTAMLNKLGIGNGSGLEITPRGSGVALGSGGGQQSVSESGYAGNASGSDIKDSTIQESKDSKKQQMIEAKEEEESNKVDVLNAAVLKIYELLDDVASGEKSFRVKVESYGLTRPGSFGGSSGAMGGVGGLGNSASGTTGGGGSGDSGAGGSSGGVNGGGVGGSIDLGGWTMI